MKKKILKFSGLLIATIVEIVTIVVFEISDWPVGSSLGGLLAGFTLPRLWSSMVDFADNTNWKTTQRKLQRANIINKDTPIRISFAYLFRIKHNGRYFLVKNTRGTGKFQPVGGVYKLDSDEAHYLRREFCAEDDNKIRVDESSKGDYRLRIKNKYLREFVKRFNKSENRENIKDLTREFKEELFDTRILNKNYFNQLKYTYCGRHTTELKYSEHFQCYELLLADIVEIELSPEQEAQFDRLTRIDSEQYIFATDYEVKSLGVKTDSGDLLESISDHTQKILIENSKELIIPSDFRNKNKTYICQIQ